MGQPNIVFLFLWSPGAVSEKAARPISVGKVTVGPISVGKVTVGPTSGDRATTFSSQTRGVEGVSASAFSRLAVIFLAG